MSTKFNPPPTDTPPSNRPSVPKSKRRYIPDLTSWLVVIFVLGIFLSMLMDGGGSRLQVKGMQTKSLAQAKQIAIALRMFADDHDGKLSARGLPAMLGAEVQDSNAALAVLFPKYLTNEAIFGNRLSVYQTRTPDNLYDDPYTGKPLKTLEPGENVYSYVAGLTIHSDEHAPLIADGTDRTGHYTTDAHKRGGVWAGKKAVVIFLDQSAAVETLTGPDDARYVPVRRTGNSGESNLLDVSGLGPDARLLDPAVNR